MERKENKRRQILDKRENGKNERKKRENKRKQIWIKEKKKQICILKLRFEQKNEP